MKVKELIKSLTIDDQTGKPINSEREVTILTGYGETSYILSIYTVDGEPGVDDELCIDIGDGDD